MALENAAPDLKYYYSIFGLRFESELELPILHATPPPNSIDVTIRFGTAPTHLDNPEDKRVLFEAKPNHFLMWFKFNPVRFYVTNGNSILIDTGGNDDWDFIRLFLLAPIVGALLHQRKVIPLHASGFEVDGSAVLFAGDSGVGKSTTAAAFKEKGYTLVADDVAVIYHKNNQPIVEPGVPFIKLWKESFDLLDKKVPENGRIRAQIEKYFVPIQHLSAQSLPIKRIYILEKSTAISEPVIKTLSSIDTVHQLRMGTYRYYYLMGLGGESSFFKMAFQIGQQAIVKHLTRPAVYPVEDLVAFIEDDLKPKK